MLPSANPDLFAPRNEDAKITTPTTSCAKHYTTKIHDLCMKAKTFTQRTIPCIGNLMASSCVNKVNTNHMVIPDSDVLVFLKEALVQSTRSGMMEKKTAKKMNDKEYLREICSLIEVEEIFTPEQVLAFVAVIKHDLIHDISVFTIKEQFQRIIMKHDTLILTGMITQSGLVRIKTTPMAMNKILMLFSLITHIYKTYSITYQTLCN